MASVLLSIVTWNSAASIDACLKTVLSQTYTDLKVWVIDNASTDETCAKVAQWAVKDSRIHFHPLTQNTGFCGGHNYVLHRTSEPLVMLVNPDVELEPDYVQQAVAAIQGHDTIGCVCGLLLQSAEDDPLIDSAGLVALPDGRFTLRAHNSRLSTLAELQPSLVDGADGALPFFKREYIIDLSVQGQFFDERFFAHKEDWDIAWRAQLYGWSTLFTPACRAVHPRQFRPGNLSLRQQLGGTIKYHAVKNQGLLWVKNIPKAQLGRYLRRGFARQAAIFLYCLVREPTSLRAYWYLWQNRRELLQARRIVQQRSHAHFHQASLAKITN